MHYNSLYELRCIQIHTAIIVMCIVRRPIDKARVFMKKNGRENVLILLFSHH